MKSFDDQSNQPVIQREMPFFGQLRNARFVPIEEVSKWETYRDAVLWCWEHRQHTGNGEKFDQSLFARHTNTHAPHMSRFVCRRTKAPMDLRPDLVPDFEGYTGWRGVTQYLARHAQVTLMEEVIESRKAA